MASRLGASVRGLLLTAPAADVPEALALLALDNEIDARGWREVALAALDQLAAQHAEIEKMREQHRGLVDEFRRARESIIRGEAA